MHVTLEDTFLAVLVLKDSFAYLSLQDGLLKNFSYFSPALPLLILPLISLFLNGRSPDSFRFIFGLFKQTIQFLQQIKGKKCPSIIQHWDLNPQSLEHKSSPVTARPGLFSVCMFTRLQCDQMLKQTVAQVFQTQPKKQPHQYLLQNDTFQKPQKLPPNIWAYIVRKFASKNFKKTPNLVTLTPTAFSLSVNIFLNECLSRPLSSMTKSVFASFFSLSGQSYKATTILNYGSRIVNINNFLIITTLES